MISWLIDLLGGGLLSNVMDLGKSYFQGQTDRHKIDGDVAINRRDAERDEVIFDRSAELDETLAAGGYGQNIRLSEKTGPLLWLKVAFGVLALSYFAAIILASVWPASGLVIQALPTPWDWVAIGGLAYIIGPELLNFVQKLRRN